MDQLQTIWMLMEFVQTSFLEKKERIWLLEIEEWQLEVTPTFNAIAKVTELNWILMHW